MTKLLTSNAVHEKETSSPTPRWSHLWSAAEENKHRQREAQTWIPEFLQKV